MATIAENLATAKAGFARQLAEISANPKPSYTVDGRTYNWNEYLRFLMESMKSLDEAIQSEEGPIEVVIQGMT
jgi:hypothetical protein